MNIDEELREIEERVAGHTPGAWRVSRKNERKVLGPDNLKIATAVVMSGPTNSRGEDEAVPNALLIAAAPDILRIARQAIDQLEEAVELLHKWVPFAKWLPVTFQYNEIPEDTKEFFARHKGADNEV